MNAETISEKEVERAKMFTDAVFAIALTLLVLELHLPDNPNLKTIDGMWQVLKEMKPRFLAFILSAVLVGGNWISVMNLQRAIIKINLFFVADLVVYLIIISLIPFCCDLIGNYPENPVSFLVFGGVCELLVMNAYVFIRYCRSHKLFHPHADIREIKRLENSLWIIVALLAAMMVLAFYNTQLSFILFLIYNLIPFFIANRIKITDHGKEV